MKLAQKPLLIKPVEALQSVINRQRCLNAGKQFLRIVGLGISHHFKHHLGARAKVSLKICGCFQQKVNEHGVSSQKICSIGIVLKAIDALELRQLLTLLDQK